MTSRYRLLLLTIPAAILAVVPACYTLIEHPRLASMDYNRPDDKQCVNCHTSEDIWEFNHPPNKPTYAGYDDAWFEYHDACRWYKRSWGYTPDVVPRTNPRKGSSASKGGASDVPAASSEKSTKKGNAVASDQRDNGTRPVPANDDKKRTEGEKSNDNQR